MNKTISSLPDASKFRSILVIIIVLICIVSFLSATDHVSVRAEDLARQRVITDIEYALSMMLYDYTIEGKLGQLEKFDRENPFIILTIYRSLPSNYRGVVSVFLEDRENNSGWYFDQQTRRLIYVSMAAQVSEYVLRYKKEPSDSVGLLRLQQVRSE